MMSIADAFAKKLAELVQNIDAAEFNPVRCALCVHLELDGKVEAVVQGYGVCAGHMLVMDEGGSILAAAKLAEARQLGGNRRKRRA